MGEAAQRGRVTMILRRRIHDPNGGSVQHLQLQQPPPPPLPPQHHHPHSHSHLQRDFVHVYPYDVIVSRNENESFGFVIISASNQYYGSTIGMDTTTKKLQLRTH